MGHNAARCGARRGWAGHALAAPWQAAPVARPGLAGGSGLRGRLAQALQLSAAGAWASGTARRRAAGGPQAGRIASRQPARPRPPGTLEEGAPTRARAARAAAVRRAGAVRREPAPARGGRGQPPVRDAPREERAAGGAVGRPRPVRRLQQLHHQEGARARGGGGGRIAVRVRAQGRACSRVLRGTVSGAWGRSSWEARRQRQGRLQGAPQPSPPRRRLPPTHPPTLPAHPTQTEARYKELTALGVDVKLCIVGRKAQQYFARRCAAPRQGGPARSGGRRGRRARRGAAVAAGGGSGGAAALSAPGSESGAHAAHPARRQ